MTDDAGGRPGGQLDEQAIVDLAVAHAKSIAKGVARSILEPFSADDNPVSVFMAGSPGAGKTEASMRLLEHIKQDANAARIDADELREHFRGQGYNGQNSHLFQKAATRMVHVIHEMALKNGVSFVMDGTFASENMARQNIGRSLKRGRGVFIAFVHQHPAQAWRFVQERESVEGRRIRAEDFATKWCASWDVVNLMKAEFGASVVLSLICKNMDGSDKFHLKSIDRIDSHIPRKYKADEILGMIE